MILIDTKLEQRKKDNNPIKVGIVGSGMMAKGLINLIENYIPGIRVAAVYNRTLEKAIGTFEYAGVQNVKFVDSPQSLDKAVRAGDRCVTDNHLCLCESQTIDVLLELTGSVEFGTKVLMDSFKHGKHIISFNAEVDATLGPILTVYADRAGVIYSGCDGDQPGVTMNLYRFVKGLSLTPLLCGNIKGLHDPYRNPSTQEAFAKEWEITPEKATSFADGTKLNLEQACIANATGMKVAKRGMFGYEFRGHVDDMKDLYDIDQLKELGGIVEYALGAKPGPGVYVYAYTDDPLNQHHLKYLKMGEGPLYSFYRPYHLCMFEIPFSISRVVDFGDYVMRPLGAPTVEVAAIAKTDLKAGTTLDGLGYYTVYGECENSEVMKEKNILPVGLADKVIMRNDVAKDAVITFDDVVYDENSQVFKLYHEQLRFFEEGKFRKPRVNNTLEVKEKIAQ